MDIAPAMIERLRARAEAERLPDLDGRVMDGHALDLEDDTFDVSASQNGVSLFPDLADGLAELVRVTKPGGRVLIVVFGPPKKVEFFGFFLGALQAAVPGFTPLPTDPPPLPFQVADPDRLRRRLTEAGLTGVTVEAVTWDTRFESATHFWNLDHCQQPHRGAADRGPDRGADGRGATGAGRDVPGAFRRVARRRPAHGGQRRRRHAAAGSHAGGEAGLRADDDLDALGGAKAAGFVITGAHSEGHATAKYKAPIKRRVEAMTRNATTTTGPRSRCWR